MSEESERMIMLLQELALLDKAEASDSLAGSVEARKRRQEIHQEIKQLAAQKTKN